MQKNKCTILSTRPLEDQLIHSAAAHDILIDCISFIETAPIQNKEIQQQVQQLSSQPITAVFTSMNAVEAVKQQLAHLPAWKCYCIGHATKEQVGDAFGADSIKGTAANAEALAEEIIRKGEQAVVFFCGNQRREELPSRLSSAGIQLTEVVVYQTKQIAQAVSSEYAGVLFFSPSAVHSFFSNNQLPPAALVFVIGQTTAAAVQQYATNRIITAEIPSKEALVRQVIAYFSTQKTNY